MRVTVGILGFGPKVKFRSLLALLDTDPDVVEVLLLWNGAPADALSTAGGLAKQHRKLRHRVLEESIGSAGGYSSLLQWYERDGVGDLIWLLDDDLSPEPESLKHLLSDLSQPNFDTTNDLLMAFRADLPEFREGRGESIEPRPGVCVGVHLLNLAEPLRTRRATTYQAKFLRWAPYGGLLVPRAALHRLGLPDERIFFYGDDTALTLRFTRSGGRIHLCRKAIVHDLEPVWNAIGGDVSNMARRIVYLDDQKAYYETRNRCYLGLVFYPGHPVIYWLNRMTFLASSLWLAIRHNRLARFRLIHRALRDGERMARQARRE